MVTTGEVSADGEIRFSLSVFDIRGDEHEIPVVLDTGYNGWLTLPELLTEVLKLPVNRSETITLGDGTERIVPTYDVRIRWDGKEFVVRAIQAEGLPLIGTRMVKGMVGTMHFTDGGPAMLFRP